MSKRDDRDSGPRALPPADHERETMSGFRAKSRGEHAYEIDMSGFAPQMVVIPDFGGRELTYFFAVWNDLLWICDHAFEGSVDVLLYDVRAVYDRFPGRIKLSALAVEDSGIRPDTGDHVGTVHNFCEVEDIATALPQIGTFVRILGAVAVAGGFEREDA